MLTFLQRQWFLLLLTLLLAMGVCLGPRWSEAATAFPRGWIVAGVMFITALPMPFGQLASAVRRGRAIGLALLLSIVVAPPVAWLLGRMFPEPLAVGLLITATVPCTLASAAVWTRRGGGNDAVALAVTLVTNLACFVVMPFWLWFFLRATIDPDGGQLSAGQLSQRLLMLVVLPVLVAQSLRLLPVIARSASKHQRRLSLVAQLGILSMIALGAMNAGAAIDSLSTQSPETSGTIGPAGWAGLLVGVLALHLLLFALGWWGSRALGSSNPDRLAVAIAGSQKTLMIGLDVALGFGGLAILPMVAYHFVQLFVDTLLVDRLKPFVTQQPPHAPANRGKSA